MKAEIDDALVTGARRQIVLDASCRGAEATVSPTVFNLVRGTTSLLDDDHLEMLPQCPQVAPV